MDTKYTEEKLNSLDKETLIRLFLSQQEQMDGLDHTMQLVLEQVADLKRQRFGRRTKRHEAENQISFMEVDGKIVFFNEAEAAAAEETGEDEGETIRRQRPKKKKGKREEDLSGVPVVVGMRSMLMRCRSTARNRSLDDTACIFPDRTWPTGRSSAQIDIWQCFMTISMRGCMITMCSRQTRPQCW